MPISVDRNWCEISAREVIMTSFRYGDFFIRQIHKFDELNRGLRKIQL